MDLKFSLSRKMVKYNLQPLRDSKDRKANQKVFTASFVLLKILK